MKWADVFQSSILVLLGVLATIASQWLGDHRQIRARRQAELAQFQRETALALQDICVEVFLAHLTRAVGVPVEDIDRSAGPLYARSTVLMARLDDRDLAQRAHDAFRKVVRTDFVAASTDDVETVREMMFAVVDELGAEARKWSRTG